MLLKAVNVTGLTWLLMDVYEFKYIAAVIVIVLAVIGSVIAVKTRSERWVDRLKALTSGVFIATSLTNLLPVAVQDLDEQSESGYPIAGAVIASTFIVMTGISIFTYTARDALRDQAKELKGEEDVEMQGRQETATSDENPPKFSAECHCLPLTVISLYVVLCIHGFLEGFVMGFAEDWGVTALLLAIGSNKLFEAFALGSVVIRARPTVWLYWILMSLTAIITSLATIIAINISASITATAHGVIVALGASTFLFIGAEAWITIFRNKKRMTTKERAWLFGLFFIGALIFVIIAVMASHHRSHDHEHEHDEEDHDHEHEDVRSLFSLWLVQ
jgi:zinc transporter 1/2/3